MDNQDSKKAENQIEAKEYLQMGQTLMGAEKYQDAINMLDK